MKLDLYKYVGRTEIDGTSWPAWARWALSRVYRVRHEREFNWRFKYAPAVDITGLARVPEFKIIISYPE